MRLMILSVAMAAVLLNPLDMDRVHPEVSTKEGDDRAKMIRLLGTCSRILKEERQRWVNIHRNPIPDDVKIEEVESGYKFRVTIETGVKNEVNRKPITRVYEVLDKKKQERFERSKFFGNLSQKVEVDAFILASGSYRAGWRPAFAAGLRFTALPGPLSDIGIGAYTTLLSAGGSVYYTSKHIFGLSLHILLGTNWQGQFSPGIGVGYKF